jgi:hypothetical protein
VGNVQYIAGDFIAHLAPTSQVLFGVVWVVRCIFGIYFAACAGFGAFFGAGAVWQFWVVYIMLLVEGGETTLGG